MSQQEDRDETVRALLEHAVLSDKMIFVDDAKNVFVYEHDGKRHQVNIHGEYVSHYNPSSPMSIIHGFDAEETIDTVLTELYGEMENHPKENEQNDH